jgi:hypothetical protein
MKRLLLGTAMGLVTVAAAQAADLPVKAKPVQYVKVCSLYGDGFYYIPGTDTCLKIGGYVRVETNWGAGGGGNVQGSGAVMLPQAKYDRQSTNDINTRVRGAITLDVRQQTEYGALRTYVRAAWDQTTPAVTGATTTPINNTIPNAGLAYWDRAFIQFAGFTIGRAQSMFDIFSYYRSDWSYLRVVTTGDSTFFGVAVWAYTAQFGNGFSGTLSLEDPNGHFKASTFDATAPGFFGINGTTVTDNAFNSQSASNNGFRVPDVIANLRVDQAWGYAGVSAAIHDASGAYFLTPNNVANGHPADKLGWAAAVGFQLNLPGGDQAGANFAYAKGATGYATLGGNWQIYNASTSVGAGWISDGIFGPGSEIELTEAWSINAAYQHIWNPKWRTTWYGGYVNIHYNEAAANLLNAALATGAGGFRCAPAVAGVTGNFTAFTPNAGNSCNPDFSFYQVGARTQWNPVAQLDIGVDVFYTHLNTAYKGPATYAANAPRPAVTLLDDQNVWSAIFRWQRNFYP